MEELTSSDEVQVKRVRRIARFVLGKIMFNVTEYNKPDLKDKKYIFCPNHLSDFDGPILWSHNNNIRILAKKECFKTKTKAEFLNKMGIVRVNRDYAGGEIKSAIKYLKKGKEKIFLLFPQGTISDINKNTLARIKPGAFYLSYISNTPIMPIFIEQPRVLSKVRIMYGNEIKVDDIYDENNHLDKEKLAIYREMWMNEIKRLEKVALEVENRPFKKLKLKKKHRNNNLG